MILFNRCCSTILPPSSTGIQSVVNTSQEGVFLDPHVVDNPDWKTLSFSAGSGYRCRMIVGMPASSTKTLLMMNVAACLIPHPDDVPIPPVVAAENDGNEPVVYAYTGKQSIFVGDPWADGVNDPFGTGATWFGSPTISTPPAWLGFPPRTLGGYFFFLHRDYLRPLTIDGTPYLVADYLRFNLLHLNPCDSTNAVIRYKLHTVSAELESGFKSSLALYDTFTDPTTIFTQDDVEFSQTVFWMIDSVEYYINRFE